MDTCILIQKFIEESTGKGMQGILNVMKHFVMTSSAEPKYIERSKTIHLENKR